jgi:hypothetical protein
MGRAGWGRGVSEREGAGSDHVGTAHPAALPQMPFKIPDRMHSTLLPT